MMALAEPAYVPFGMCKRCSSPEAKMPIHIGRYIYLLAKPLNGISPMVGNQNCEMETVCFEWLEPVAVKGGSNVVPVQPPSME